MNKLSVIMNRTEKLLGWIYYPLQLLVIPSVISIINLLLGSPLSLSGSNILFFFINFFCTALIFHRFLIKNGKISAEAPLRCLGCAAVGLIAYWLLSYVVGFIIYAVEPDFFNVNDAYVNEMVQENYILMGLCTVLLVPVTEELLYRGLIFGQLYNKNRLAAYLISALAFAVVHILSYIGSYSALRLCLCLLQYLPAGLCLGWAYARADSIWAPILIHVTINQIAISVQ